MSEEPVTLVRDGQAALADGRWSDAATAFASALELDEVADAAFGMAVARWWLADNDQAIRGWERAFVLYRRSGEPLGATMAAFYLCLAYQMTYGNAAAARGWLARASRIAEGVDGAAGWIAVARAHLAIDDGKPLAAERWARDAVAAAMGDVDLELCATSELGAALMEQGRIEEGGALLDEAMAGALAGEGRRDRDAIVLISCRTITASSRGGDLRRVIEWVAAADGFNRRFGSPHLFATCRAQYGAILVATGRWREAERELLHALELASGAETAVRADAATALAELRVRQGRPDDAEHLLDGLHGQPVTVLARALIHMARDEARLAAALLRRRLREIDHATFEATRLLDLHVDAALASGRTAEAETAAANLTTAAATTSSPAMAARAERSAGRIALARGLEADAISHFERADVAYRAADLPLESAWCRLDVARLSAVSDPDAAIVGARDALAVFESLGAAREADAAASVLRTLGVRPARRRGPPSGLLSRRELEVLALLGEGLSNPEIADRLFITRKTVEHHVASILGKTGMRGRAEAAVWAVRSDVDAIPEGAPQDG